MAKIKEALTRELDEENAKEWWLNVAAAVVLVAGLYQSAQFIGGAYDWTRDAFIAAVAERVQDRIHDHRATTLFKWTEPRTAGQECVYSRSGVKYCF